MLCQYALLESQYYKYKIVFLHMRVDIFIIMSSFVCYWNFSEGKLEKKKILNI